MAKEEAIEVEGTIVEPLPNAMFQVELDNGHTASRPISPEKCGCTISKSSRATG